MDRRPTVLVHLGDADGLRPDAVLPSLVRTVREGGGEVVALLRGRERADGGVRSPVEDAPREDAWTGDGVGPAAVLVVLGRPHDLDALRARVGPDVPAVLVGTGAAVTSRAAVLEGADHEGDVLEGVGREGHVDDAGDGNDADDAGAAPRTPEELGTAAGRVALRLAARHGVAAGTEGPPDVTLVPAAAAAARTEPARPDPVHAACDDVRHRLEERAEVGAALLRGTPEAARDLGWLASTHVPAALLVLVDDAPTVPGSTRAGAPRVVGLHDPEGVVGLAVGETVRADELPPASLVAAARRAGPDHVCVVVAVDDGVHPGALALVGRASDVATYRLWADVVARRLTTEVLEQNLRHSEARYAHVARASGEGLWELTPPSDVLYASERCRELLGAGRDDVLTVGAWLDRIHPDDRGPLIGALEAADAEGRPVDVEYRLVTPEGPRWRRVRGLRLEGPSGPGGINRMVGSLADVHERKVLEERLRRAALYDEVTGLPNRRFLLDRLHVALEEGRRRDDAGFAVVFLDLDGFKMVNDSLGHLHGDHLLHEVARRLTGVLRAGDVAARFGGDEFAVLLHDLVPDEVLVIADRIQEEIGRPVRLGDEEVQVTASIGIATSGTGYEDPEDVLRDADIAMYHAKELERGSASVFDPDMHVRAASRLKTRSEVRTALARGQFVVHYQPIVPLAGGADPHFEALVRWQHPERGLLQPTSFLLAMEDDATIVALGAHVLDEACRQVAAWRAEHHVPVTVSVNLSHREFWSDRLLVTVGEALRRHEVDPACLVLEITEGVVMAEPARARDVMRALRDRGVGLHIDDFGTGHSSLNVLRTFPVDALKIDGSFVRELGLVEQTDALVRIIVDMGRALGLDVVAEHVETEAQADRLRALGCRYAQGWLYGAALPAAEAGHVVAQRAAARG